MAHFLKMKLSIIVTWVFIYFYPTYEFILLVGFFVAADSITGGLLASREGIFTSGRFRRVIPKFLVYGIAVLVAHVIQEQFFPEFPAMKMIAGLIAYAELVSIDENIEGLTGVSLFKFFINKLKKNNDD